MILIFGGSYQGKLKYAIERFGLTEEDIYRCDTENTETPGNKRLIYEIDKWILALIKDDADVNGAVRLMIDEHENSIIVCNDISCGVVPEDPIYRKWREAVGKAMAELVETADEVVRLFCGIPCVLKRNGELK